MKQIWLMTIIAVCIPVSAWTQQIPENPPRQLWIQIRFYGTTEQRGRDQLRFIIHTNGEHPASIHALRPVFDDRGNTSVDSPQHNGELKEEDLRKIYTAARSVIVNHRIGEVPAGIRDGDSVEITIGSSDRKIAAVFDHSSAEKSKEVESLLTLINAQFPKEFQSKNVNTALRSK